MYTLTFDFVIDNPAPVKRSFTDRPDRVAPRKQAGARRWDVLPRVLPRPSRSVG